MSTLTVLATTLGAGGESKKSGPIGLAIILLLCVACYFLFKSMSKHLRKVREEFPTDAPPQGGELSTAAPQPPSESTESAEPAESAAPDGSSAPAAPNGDRAAQPAAHPAQRGESTPPADGSS